MNVNEFIWTEKYRPQTVEECILPPHLKETFQAYVNGKDIPNLLLFGGPGVGKTSVAEAMLKELDVDYLKINGSLNGNIDTLRYEIKGFAESNSLFKEGRKAVILDEADYLNGQSTQPALRNFMEEYSGNCFFILTANYKNKIIKELHSRCANISFRIPKEEEAKLQTQFFKKVEAILTNEGVTYDRQAVARFIALHYPDMRVVLNELQNASAAGPITSAILMNSGDTNFTDLMKLMKKKDFKEMRKWVAMNSTMDFSVLIRRFYDRLDSLIVDSDRPSYILIAAKYQHYSAFAVDQEVTMAAFLTEIMANVSFT